MARILQVKKRGGLLLDRQRQRSFAPVNEEDREQNSWPINGSERGNNDQFDHRIF